jgi:Zn-dependent protease
MRWSYRILRVSGISVELHLTFLLFALLVLASGGVQSLLLLSLIFAIVLAHELVHSLTAVLHGIKVPRIILTPIGGLASIELPDDPLLELKVSIVGPLFNFFLAGVGLVLLVALNPGNIGLEQVAMGVVSDASEIGSVNGMLIVLVSVNMMLGGFNMLPAFPMDGGRVFRSVLALWVDYELATRIANTIGQVIFLGLAVYGILSGNIWLVLIGVFLSYAGGSEVNYVRLRAMFGDTRLRDLAAPGIIYANENLSWRDFLLTVYRRGSNLYLIVDGGGVMKKVLDLSKVGDADPGKIIGETPGVEYIVLDGGVNAADALKVALARKLILVAEEGRLIGYLTAITLGESASYISLAKKTGLKGLPS